MKKNIMVLALVFILAIFVVGCSTENGGSENANKDPSQSDVAVEQEDGLSEEELEKIKAEIEIVIGELAPDLVYENQDGEQVFLKNLEGENVSLEDYRGKIIFLNFWATWCVYCDMEMPDLQKIDNENDDLVVIAVNVQEDKETVEKYMNEGNYEFEVALDEDGILAEKYLVSSFPNTYVIDKDGIFLGRVPGMMVYDQMVSILEDVRQSQE